MPSSSGGGPVGVELGVEPAVLLFLRISSRDKKYNSVSKDRRKAEGRACPPGSKLSGGRVEILIVEDDRRMSALLKRGLEREGHVSIVASDGVEGLDFGCQHDFDVILLDVMLRGMDGMVVARKLRERGRRTPILMLTAKDTPRDIVSGLDSGADDYLTKPFTFQELLARLRAVSRRGPIPQPVILTVADLKLDPGSHEARRGARKLALTRRVR